MTGIRKQLILWTGPKHSGKTTRAGELVKAIRREGFNIAGLLAPSIYHNGKLFGFDVFDLHNNTQVPLARIKEQSTTRRFAFLEDGLKLGQTALSITATKFADVVIVDEFGPLELEGNLWRKNVDALLNRQNNMILLVVRQDLVKEVRLLYEDFSCKELPALEPESIGEVINIIKRITNNINA